MILASLYFNKNLFEFSNLLPPRPFKHTWVQTSPQFFILTPSMCFFPCSCVTNCKGKMNPTSSFGLQGSCANCLDDVVKYLEYKWTLFVLDDDGISFNKVANFTLMSATGNVRSLVYISYIGKITFYPFDIFRE